MSKSTIFGEKGATASAVSPLLLNGKSMSLKDIPRLGLNIPRPTVIRQWPRTRQANGEPGLLPATIRPIVVVPGVLGTWPPAQAPRGRLDPLTWAYANLLEGLERLGYVPGVSLFGFAYDWRLGASELAAQLGQEIERIRALSPAEALRHSSVPVDYSRVDLIGHSLGGLIGRLYVQSEHYADDVARLFLVAAPMRGAVAAYSAYEGGDSTYIGIPVEGARSMIALIRAMEAGGLRRRARIVYRTVRKRDLPDLHQYMQDEFLSIRDLLPVGDCNYLYRVGPDGQEELYPFGEKPGYRRNPLLEEFNNPARLAQLDRVDQIFCLYSGSQQTIARLQVEEPGPGLLYRHGRPTASQPAANLTPGDNVVPVESARLDLPVTRPDGQPWRVRVHHEDIAHTLGLSLGHVEVIGDPVPVRHLLGYFVQPQALPLSRAVWDGPLVRTRRVNYRALFI